ncbi:MAG TPA: hypothetical protein VGW38_25385 [Chloroflexota bacterium]|nr:hypothetical protein [Chloroflexota bacterium]
MDQECRQLTTLAEFEDARRREDGFIVIRDSARIQPNRIHRPDCHWVHPGYFREKVEDNSGRHGDYHYCRDYDAALALAQSGPWALREAGPCQDCNPAA